MYSPPSGFFTFLLWFAGIGVVSVIIGGGWLAYHLVRAVLYYVGAI